MKLINLCLSEKRCFIHAVELCCALKGLGFTELYLKYIVPFE